MSAGQVNKSGQESHQAASRLRCYAWPTKAVARWFRKAENRDALGHSLVHSFVRSFAHTAHSLDCSTLLALFARSAALTHEFVGK